MPTPAEAHFAKEAERLLADETLAEAFSTVRMNALLALAEVNVGDTTEILRLQAIARCLLDVRNQLSDSITKMGSANGGFTPNEPTSKV